MRMIPQYTLLATATVLLLANAGCGLRDFSPFGRAVLASELANAPRWHQSIDEALAEAAQVGKPVLVAFTRIDWSDPCEQLNDEVFSDPQFHRWAEENVVLLNVDFPSQPADLQQAAANKELAIHYGRFLSGYPTVLLVDTSGEVIGKIRYTSGGAGQWVRQAELMLGQRAAVTADQAPPAVTGDRKPIGE